MTKGTVKVAAAQVTPVFMDRKATIVKACDTIAEAGKNGARLVVFPETFVPGYPDWVWTATAGTHRDIHQAMYAELLDQAVSIPSPATDALCRAAKKAGVYVVIGVNELSGPGGSLYNTLIYIDDEGEIMGRHRKLVPTMGERLVWAPGDGSTLEAYETSIGRLGGLICWENYMPLARYAMYAWGVQIYVAPTWDSSDGWVGSMQHIAREGRTAVIGCCMAIRRSDIPDKYEFKKLYPPSKSKDEEWVNDGNSVIVAPGGRILAGPVAKEETILYADLDPAAERGSKFSLDVAGHYARPDVFQLTVNRGPAELVNVAGDIAPATNGKVKTPAKLRRK
uniref:Nitrilase n=1 Tax=uncultured organism TaxID=155900 RepID=Q6RWH8_9ZZZZ|nr:nitrilase [uncultured organism]